MSLEQLIDAYKRGAIPDPLYLDNDTVDAYADDKNVFSMHPEDLLKELLGHVSIPWEMV